MVATKAEERGGVMGVRGQQLQSVVLQQRLMLPTTAVPAIYHSPEPKRGAKAQADAGAS